MNDEKIICDNCGKEMIYSHTVSLFGKLLDVYYCYITNGGCNNTTNRPSKKGYNSIKYGIC